MKKSNISYDKKSDSLYILIKKGEEDSFEEVEPNIIIEYNKKKEPIAIEILNASRSLFKKVHPFASFPQSVNEKTSFYKTSTR